MNKVEEMTIGELVQELRSVAMKVGEQHICMRVPDFTLRERMDILSDAILEKGTKTVINNFFVK